MPYGQQKTFRPNVHNAAVQLQSLRSVFIRFNELLCKAGSEHNRSRFIVKRSFCEEFTDRKSTRLNSSHTRPSRMPSSA